MKDYPEHEKLKAVQPQSQCQGEFLDWLGEQGISLCRIERNDYWPIRESIQDLLAKYHEIDRGKLEAEKRAMLDAQRKLNKQSKP